MRSVRSHTIRTSEAYLRLPKKDGQTAPKDKGNIQRTSSRQPMAEDGGMIPTSRHSAVTHLLGSADLRMTLKHCFAVLPSGSTDRNDIRP